MENLATGGDFYDTSGDALRVVLPGGAQHDALRAYLDRTAVTAHAAVAADGTAIPIVFRPWHENAGSWSGGARRSACPASTRSCSASRSSTCAT